MNNFTKQLYPDLWPVGPAGLVASDRVIVAGRWDSAPIKRAVRTARSKDLLIDLTFGQACKWVLFLDSGHLVLAAIPIPLTVFDNKIFQRVCTKDE